MDSEINFCLRRIVELAMEHNVSLAVNQLKFALLHLEMAEGLVKTTRNLDYSPAKLCINQLIALIESQPEQPKE